MPQKTRKELIALLDEQVNPTGVSVVEVMLRNAHLFPEREREVAELLMRSYPSVGELICSEMDALYDTSGLNASAAKYLRTLGLISKRLVKDPDTIRNTEEFIALMTERFFNKVSEFAFFYFVSKSGKIRRVLSYTSKNIVTTDVDVKEIYRAIAAVDCQGVYMAHNHVKGGIVPSYADDLTTLKIAKACEFAGKKLLEHCIIDVDGNVFRYVKSGRLARLIKNDAPLFDG